MLKRVANAPRNGVSYSYHRSDVTWTVRHLVKIKFNLGKSAQVCSHLPLPLAFY